jgi:hypothetical protein
MLEEYVRPAASLVFAAASLGGRVRLSVIVNRHARLKRVVFTSSKSIILAPFL